jgi:hypothetical protein
MKASECGSKATSAGLFTLDLVIYIIYMMDIYDNKVCNVILISLYELNV